MKISMNSGIKLAIENAVSEAGQSEDLAYMIFRWFKELASGNQNLAPDSQDAKWRVGKIYDSVCLPGEDDNDDLNSAET